MKYFRTTLLDDGQQLLNVSFKIQASNKRFEVRPLKVPHTQYSGLLKRFVAANARLRGNLAGKLENSNWKIRPTKRKRQSWMKQIGQQSAQYLASKWMSGGFSWGSKFSPLNRRLKSTTSLWIGSKFCRHRTFAGKTLSGVEYRGKHTFCRHYSIDQCRPAMLSVESCGCAGTGGRLAGRTVGRLSHRCANS